MSDFYRTRMGHRFFEATMPELVRQIDRLNDNLERLIAALERRSPTNTPMGPTDKEAP